MISEREQIAAERQEIQRQHEENLRNLGWLEILRTPYDGKHLRDSEANRSVISSWVNLDEVPNARWLAERFQENPTRKERLIWNPPPLTPEQEKKQDAA